MGDGPGEGFGTVVGQEQELSSVIDGDDLVETDEDLDDVVDDEEDDDDEEGGDEEDLSSLEEEGEIAADYIEGLLDIADLDGDIDMDVEGDRAIVSVVGATLDELVGDDGEVLEALQELTRLAVHRKTGSRARLMLDVGGFRAKRRADLAELGRSDCRGGIAERRAQEAARHVPVRAEDHPRRCRARRAAERVGGRGAEPARGGLPGRLRRVTVAADVPAEAASVFGGVLDKARRYAELLATDGVTRGLIGPRETGRLWDRHLLNCAVVAELVPEYGRMVDIGSGAGLPGIVLAMLRPSLEVTLLEPLLRRAVFLEECVAELGLANATVLRARAEDKEAAQLRADIATARAVAPLGRLAGWAAGLLRPGGQLLAIKGQSADEELAAARSGSFPPWRAECGGSASR